MLDAFLKVHFNEHYISGPILKESIVHKCIKINYERSLFCIYFYERLLIKWI